MKRIPLPRGGYALVDDADYERLCAYRWYTNGRGYVQRDDGKTTAYMHRIVMECPDGLEVDHINGDRADNRRANLRLCTRAQNTSYRTHAPRSSSGFFGVYWRKDRERWLAQIDVGSKQIYLGLFTDPIEAAHAYDEASVRLRGAFATVNFSGGRA